MSLPNPDPAQLGLADRSHKAHLFPLTVAHWLVHMLR